MKEFNRCRIGRDRWRRRGDPTYRSAARHCAATPRNAIRALNEQTYDETVIGIVPSPLMGKFASIEMGNNHAQKFRTSSVTMSANFSGRGSSSASFL